MNFPRASVLFLCSALLFSGCSVVDRLPSGVDLGTSMGSRMGASFGKRNGNSAICAVIGAALAGSAGNLIDRYIAEIKGERPGLYIVNGVPYTEKKAARAYKKAHKDDVISISTMPPTEAVQKYGPQGEKGAIVIALANTSDVIAENIHAIK